MIDPTREEWLDARERALALWPHNAPGDTHWDKVVVAVLGPCPPEPAPPTWRLAGVSSLAVCEAPLVNGRRRVWVGWPNRLHEKLTPDEADAMAAALIEHASYCRRQGADDA